MSANTFEFQYQLLDRCRTDCKYYLSYGSRQKQNLWGRNVDVHIAKMKEIWKMIPEKPEWLSWQEILYYEKIMTGDNDATRKSDAKNSL